LIYLYKNSSTPDIVEELGIAAATAAALPPPWIAGATGRRPGAISAYIAATNINAPKMGTNLTKRVRYVNKYEY
jgi:hypothetical protein